MLTDQKELAPVQWRQLVAELAEPAPDDRAFLDRLLRVLGQVAAARQAVVYVPMTGERGEVVVRPIALWPSTGKPGAAPALQFEQDATRAAYAAVESGTSRAFLLSGETDGNSLALSGGSGASAGGGGGGVGGGPMQGHVLAIALPSEPRGKSDGKGAGAGESGSGVAQLAPCAGAVTLLVEPRSRQALQSTLALAEVIIGYIHLHAARGAVGRALSASASLDAATRLLASLNGADSFRGAAIQLTNDLSRRLGADRVALAWVYHDTCRVVALSDTEHFDRRTVMLRRLEAAMDECLDQDQAVLYPAPPAGTDAVLHAAVVHEHRELAAGDPRLRICSIPLRQGGEVVGVVTIESRAQGGAGGVGGAGGASVLDVDDAGRLQAALDLVTPMLALRQRDDWSWARRSVESMRRTGAWLVGPRHTLSKVAGLLLLGALVFTALYRTEHRVGARAELKPAERRIVATPFDGVIRTLAPGVEAGAHVGAGQMLAELDTAELRLQLQDARARQLQAETSQAAAMKENKPAEAGRMAAQGDAARAQVELYQSRLDRARIVAPIAGTVISGDLRDKIGASSKLGEELFQIAPLAEMVATVKVDESDLLLDEAGGAFIRPGSRGVLATRSNPGAEFPITVLRVVPLAQAGEGKNEFEVWVSVDRPAPWMRPGMEAMVRLESGERSLLWIGTRKIVNTVRLWLW
ncbi:hypothetical protein BH11PLA1_BH11PLA1_00300 [soil metagenome]